MTGFDIYTIKKVNNRAEELKQAGDYDMLHEMAYYWLKHLQEILANIEQTSLNDSDKRERIHSLAQKLIS